MATVRLQRRSPRPPRRRLQAAGNGPRTRGHALPAPWPSPRRAPGPGDAASSPARRPPPGARKPAASPRTSMAPHPSSAAKVSPRGAEGQKPLPKVARTSGGARPGRPSARSRPERRRGPRGHMQLFVFCPARRCLRAASGCRMVSLGRDTWRSPRGRLGAPRPASPEPCPPDLPSACRPVSSKFCPVLEEKRPRSPPRTGRELVTFTLLFKLARRHHQQITLSCRAGGRPDATAPASPC